ncbi:50S ribosomal protein L10 [Candidatus Parcubacteria bacterium]|nr:50S ribosomal protein L10 [Candidatus Parcubacteria bacterium]
MPLTKAKKIERVADIKSALAGAPVVVATDFTGLATAQIAALRRKIRPLAGRYTVAKKTLLKRALAGLGLGGALLEGHAGQVGLAIGRGEESGFAKALVEFRKGAEQLVLLGGYVAGNWVSADQITALAKLPGRQALLGQVAGSIAAPMSGFVRVLQGNITGLVRVLGRVGGGG